MYRFTLSSFATIKNNSHCVWCVLLRALNESMTLLSCNCRDCECEPASNSVCPTYVPGCLTGKGSRHAPQASGSFRCVVSGQRDRGLWEKWVINKTVSPPLECNMSRARTVEPFLAVHSNGACLPNPLKWSSKLIASRSCNLWKKSLVSFSRLAFTALMRADITGDSLNWLGIESLKVVRPNCNVSHGMMAPANHFGSSTDLTGANNSSLNSSLESPA